MRLVIVEDTPALRENLKIILAGEDGITVSGDYDCAEDALANLEQDAPEVMLVDLGLPRMSGLELISRVKAGCSRLDILVYTVFDDWKSVFTALKAGASGYILKGTKPRELVEAITSLYDGGAPMSPKIARMVITEFHEESPGGHYALTLREKEILSAMDKRMAYKEIASMMHISPHTVRTHIRNIYEKLQAKNRSEALQKARKDNAI